MSPEGLVNGEPVKVMNTRTFDLSQKKGSTSDFVVAFHSAVEKRTRGLTTDVFVGLSSGYDSGAIAAAAAKIGRRVNAYTVRGEEVMEIVERRVERMEEVRRRKRRGGGERTRVFVLAQRWKGGLKRPSKKRPCETRSLRERALLFSPISPPPFAISLRSAAWGLGEKRHHLNAASLL
jgi:hypothetical protein